MKNFSALYKKELAAYYHSLLSYLFIVVFLVVLSWMSWQNLFLIGQATMRDFFTLLPWFYLFLLPALTMRSWSEEKRLGTMETLLTLPISDRKAVLAKFLAGATFLGVVLLVSLPLPFTLASLGNLDWGATATSYLGAWFFGLAYLALGQWISSLTKNQIVSFLVTIVICFVFLLLGLSFFIDNGGLISKVFYFLSTLTHFQNLLKGVIDARDIIYYFSFILLFLYLNTLVLRKQRRPALKSTKALVAVALAVGINILVFPFSYRLDLTQNKQYTLSGATKNIIENLSDTVTIKVFFSDKVPQNLYALKRDVKDVVEDYRVFGKGHINVEIISPDPQTSSGDTTSEVVQYGIPAIQFNVVGSEKLEVSQGYAGLAILYKDKHESIPVIADSTNLEYDLTAKIQKMTTDNPPKIAFLSDHGTMSTTLLQKSLSDQYTVGAVTLKTEELAEYQGLIIAGPTDEFTKEDKYVLDQFVMHGGKLFVLLNGMTVDEQLGTVVPNKTGLDDLLAKYGVTVNKDVVGDFGSPEMLQFGNGLFVVQQPYPLWPRLIAEGFNLENPITSKLSALTLPWPSSLVVEASDGTTITDLAKTTKQSFAYTTLPGISPDLITTPQPDQTQAYTVAALIEGNAESFFTDKDKPAGVDESKYVSSFAQAAIFIVADSQFASDDILKNSPDNALLLMNAVDALSQENSLISIRSRNALNRPLKSIDDSQKALIKYLNIFSSVIIVVVLALGAYFIRRRQDRKAQNFYQV
ncbi:MAG: hypothetical protein A2458_03870 [Candidatus Kerfeldbacteria bacterium RIFOXYC2_FULL_38_9]|uniref:Uncharacterized protein n=1 Tax=Candidatus Kerfeldbacteria bacterium RIFOXYB2_FULL_38_14 TaxID=1798547 RepID=A0A1G2BCI7_9BACT|nr:MAG: hypothetical protein A2319_00275 [Candidatus Kerfeldbacteria bacterium RIFOXYB2_FULL_38_14]OGY90103.1 MAG: hypothetical protein A2458_03870 [Candidatus Kerfeldbacteria bacterium RIFOXYC2_FULL_38_9]